MPRRYPSEFRRRVLDLLAAGRSVAQVAAELQISEQAIYGWRRQHLIDTGQLPGLSSTDNAELVAARRRIAELETELAITRRAAELLKAAVPPKRRFEAIAVMAGEGLPAQTSCRVLDVTDSGYYAWRGRGPSAREVRHALADRTDSPGPCRLQRHLRCAAGARRAHPRTRRHGWAQRDRDVDATRRHQRTSGEQTASTAAPDTNCGRPGRPALHPARTQPAVGHRHHRTPNSGREGRVY